MKYTIWAPGIGYRIANERYVNGSKGFSHDVQEAYRYDSFKEVIVALQHGVAGSMDGVEVRQLNQVYRDAGPVA